MAAKSDYDTFKDVDLKESDKSYTIDEALDKIGPGRFQLRVFSVCGWIWMGDAIEIMIISLLGPVLECEWDLELWQQASINTAILFGLLLGGLIMGVLADLYGRKKVLLLCAVFAAVYGLQSSIAPNFWWMMTLRGISGIFLGGLFLTTAYTAEVTSTNLRGKLIPPQVAMFALGNFLTVLFAMLTVNYLSWRVWMALCSLPVILGIFLITLLPESPRYNLAAGKTEDAVKVLQKIADLNKGSLPEGKLRQELIKSNKLGDIKELLSPGLRRLFLQCVLHWFMFAFLYYGAVIYGTELIRMGNICPTKDVFTFDTFSSESSPTHCKLQCDRLTTEDYLLIMGTTAGDFTLVPLCVISLEVIGRKPTLIWGSCLHALGLLMLVLFCVPKALLIVLIITIRTSGGVMGTSLQLYQTEAFPTNVRTTAFGTAYSLSRIGTSIVPFISQVLVRQSPKAGLSIFFAVATLSAVNAIFLPLETKGKQM